MASWGNFQGKDMCMWVFQDDWIQHGGGEVKFFVACIWIQMSSVVFSFYLFSGQFWTLSLFPNLQKVHGRAWFVFLLLCFSSNWSNICKIKWYSAETSCKGMGLLCGLMLLPCQITSVHYLSIILYVDYVFIGFLAFPSAPFRAAFWITDAFVKALHLISKTGSCS